MKTFLDDGYEHVDGHRDPDLGFHGVLGHAVELLDAQVLLHSLEKRIDLPAVLVEGTYAQRGNAELIGQERQSLARFRIDVSDASQPLWIVALGLVDRQLDVLVADQPGTANDGHRVDGAALEIGLGPRNEERTDVLKG